MKIRVIVLFLVLLVVSGCGSRSTSISPDATVSGDSSYVQQVPSTGVLDPVTVDELVSQNPNQKELELDEDYQVAQQTEEIGREQAQKQIPSQPGVYQEYSTAGVSALMAKGSSVVLFFFASWDPTCIDLDGDILDHKGLIPTDLAILKIDFDAATDLRKQYKVNQQNTVIVIDPKGKELARRSVGVSSLQDVLKLFDQ